jgi:hypothetical protein
VCGFFVSCSLLTFRCSALSRTEAGRGKEVKNTLPRGATSQSVVSQREGCICQVAIFTSARRSLLTENDEDTKRTVHR